MYNKCACGRNKKVQYKTCYGCKVLLAASFIETKESFERRERGDWDDDLSMDDYDRRSAARQAKIGYR